MSLILRPRPWKWLGMLLGCLAFCGVAVLMLRDGRLAGWFCLAVFGLGSLIAALALLPGANYLRLDEEGFTFSSLFRAHHVRWADVQDFAQVQVASNRMVGWRYREGREPEGRGVRLSLAIAGCHAALPENIRGESRLHQFKDVASLAQGYLSAAGLVGRDPARLVELPENAEGRTALMRKLGLPEKVEDYDIENLTADLVGLLDHLRCGLLQVDAARVGGRELAAGVLGFGQADIGRRALAAHATTARDGLFRCNGPAVVGLGRGGMPWPGGHGAGPVRPPLSNLSAGESEELASMAAELDL